MANDPYQELGVPRTADADALRKSFRKLAKQLHPDKNPGDAKAEERFKRVSAAFDLLGDPEKKAKFDSGEIDADGREVSRGFDPRGGGGGGGGGFGGAGAGQGGFGARFEGADLDDILGEMFGRGGGGGGFGRGGGSFQAKGGDVSSRLEIDLEEAIARRQAKRRVVPRRPPRSNVTISRRGDYDGQTFCASRVRAAPGRGAAPAGDALIELSRFGRMPVFRRRRRRRCVMDLPVSAPRRDPRRQDRAAPTRRRATVLADRAQGDPTPARSLQAEGPGPQSIRRRAVAAICFARLVVTLPETVDDPSCSTRSPRRWRRDRPYAAKRRG